MGRQVGVWPDSLIFKQVIIPWLVKTLAALVLASLWQLLLALIE